MGYGGRGERRGAGSTSDSAYTLSLFLDSSGSRDCLHFDFLVPLDVNDREPALAFVTTNEQGLFVYVEHSVRVARTRSEKAQALPTESFHDVVLNIRPGLR